MYARPQSSLLSNRQSTRTPDGGPVIEFPESSAKMIMIKTNVQYDDISLEIIWGIILKRENLTELDGRKIRNIMKLMADIWTFCFEKRDRSNFLNWSKIVSDDCPLEHVLLYYLYLLSVCILRLWIEFPILRMTPQPLCTNTLSATWYSSNFQATDLLRFFSIGKTSDPIRKRGKNKTIKLIILINKNN